nr:hypothetical protein [Tanacetum cinerariifolium]
MGESEWVEANRNKRRSVFDRLNYTRGQAYAFCRYIKVESAETIIDALCRIRIGKLWLHANVARFSRNVASKKGCVMIMGDFNEVREANERYGSSFNPRHANAFNSFIDTSLLNDISLGGYRFTWSVNKGSKMSKLDRFLVSEDFLDSYHSITGVVLEKGLPDHRSILLKLFEVDYGPTPFRFFHSWLEMDGFKDLDSWCGSGTLKSLFPRVYYLEVDKNCFVADRFSIQGWSPVHRRSPRGGFSVTLARNHIDALTLDVSSTVTRWNKAIPIKINVFLWRLSLNKLATRINLDRRVTYSIRVRELCSWTPTFVGEDSDVDDVKIDHEGKDVGTDDESTSISGSQSSNEFFDNDDENIGDPVLEEEVPQINEVKPIANDSDPFGLNELIEKTSSKTKEVVRSPTPEHPPGFTPAQSIIEGLNNHPSDPSIPPVHSSSISHDGHSGFSMIERLQETIRVGMALGLNMDGCENTLTTLTAGNGESKVGGFPTMCKFCGLMFMLWKGCVMIMGDFNEVREANERYGSSFNPRHADAFNSFIDTSLLNDISLGGYRFTWSDNKGSKMSKLDRFLNDGVMEANGLVSFKKKLQHLKRVIRSWVNTKRVESAKIKKEHQDTLSTIDHLIDQGIVSEDDLSRRRDAIRVLNDRRQLAIKGIFINGDWVEDPTHVKREFYDHFSNRFKITHDHPTSFGAAMHNVLTLDQREFLERPITSDEIKRAIWDCGGDRAPVPDGFTMVISSCISSEQSAFVKGRNILDGPIIINEVIAWYRKHKKNLMVFKVDFEKAFDSLRWDYLDLIMSKFGFGSLWRSWILGCLRNDRSSILINGSPTQEFDIQRGLHVLSRKAESLGLFKGVSISYEGMQISHLMFADDVIFLGEWSRVSAINLLSML